jgi:F-type H+-transporting ATPase subunit a
MSLFLAVEDITPHLVDHPWTGEWVHHFGRGVTLMSNAIASMFVVAIIIVAIVIPLARRYSPVPTRGKNVLEVLVIFVRDMIAKPALHDKAYLFLPYLCTMFVFILGMNLFGMMPIQSLSTGFQRLLGLSTEHPLVGGTATSVMTTCGGLAALSFCTIAILALRRFTIKCHEKYHLPIIICLILAPLMWINSFAPHLTGVAKYVLYVPMMLLEFVGLIAKCFALMIRLFANMIAGHTMLAVLMMLGLEQLQALVAHQTYAALYADPIVIMGAVAVDVMELLVAALQAYVFTFLTAIFLAIYVEPAH